MRRVRPRRRIVDAVRPTLLAAACLLALIGAGLELSPDAQASARSFLVGPLPSVTPSQADEPASPAASTDSGSGAAGSPVGFSWPAAGLTVNLVPMTWDPHDPVDPPLDSSHLDPVGHWLIGTGEGRSVRPIVIAGHTCHAGVTLCNEQTFPFNRLSFAGWAVGQEATVTDSLGRTAQYYLASRKTVDKSKPFSFGNEPCTLVAFSCNFLDPDGQIVLVTFHRAQCA